MRCVARACAAADPGCWGAIAARISPAAAEVAGLGEGGDPRTPGRWSSAEFLVRLDERVPEGCVWLPARCRQRKSLVAGSARSWWRRSDR